MPLLNWRALCAQALRLSDRANITQHAHTHTHTHTHTRTYACANGSVVASSIAKIHRDQIAYSHYVVSNLLIMVAKSSQIPLQLSGMQLISTERDGHRDRTGGPSPPLSSPSDQLQRTGKTDRHVTGSSRSHSSSQGSAVRKKLSTRHRNNSFIISDFCFSTCMGTCLFKYIVLLEPKHI